MEYQAINIKAGPVLRSKDLTTTSKKIFRYMIFWGYSFSSLKLSYELKINIINIDKGIQELLLKGYIKKVKGGRLNG